MNVEPGRPLLSAQRLRSLDELQSFFHTVCYVSRDSGACHSSVSNSAASWIDRKIKSSTTPGTSRVNEAVLSDEARLKRMTDREYMEHLMEKDLLDPFPS